MNHRQFVIPDVSGTLSRRHFVTGMASVGMALGAGNALSAPQINRLGQQTLRGQVFDLDINYLPVNFTGKARMAVAVNGSVPAPILRWKEGERVTLRVKNHLAEDSSIHWHGLILPTDMDGVPGLSFSGIQPGGTYEYQFDVNQSGTYWYHSHSGFQESLGMYGAIVVEPKDPDPVSYDRDYVVLLSDWSDEQPDDIYAKLKKQSHYYNFRERTVKDIWRDVKNKGAGKTWDDRAMWNKMRMSDTDIADVTGYTYTYLMNGATADESWLGLFNTGEKVRLRFINGASMTIFDVRIPGLKMTVVAADGQNVEPVSIDEFRIGVAETYDVVVEPDGDSAYTIFAQSIDRTGFTRGTLTTDARLHAPVPEMDATPVLGHRDMGHGGMDHSQHQHHGMHVMNHSEHNNGPGAKLGKAGFGSARDITHVPSEFGAHVDMRVDSPANGVNDPGIGLRQHQEIYGRRMLTYGDIKNLYSTPDPREPGREIELHLTGNMSRYMWSMNGVNYLDSEPIQLNHGERVRITLVNDTMMTHPMHLHGMWSDLETGDPEHIPRKHTVIVQPGSKISYLVTADAIGRWAYHCHLMYHMLGMFREVRVR